MFQSVRIGSLFDIPIKLDVTLLVVIPLFAWLIGSQIADSITLLNTTIDAGITQRLWSNPTGRGCWERPLRSDCSRA
jgi:hypothetical protein